MLTGTGRSLTGRAWHYKDAEPRIAQGLAQQHGLPPLVAGLMATRGIDLDTAAHFLEPTLRALLPDPSSLQDMDRAADRLAHAVTTQETVAIFGDYDVDGACSGAIMVTTLRTLGCPVLHYVPDRLKEGYGPNGPALHSLHAQGATLIVCVDCGTAAASAFVGVHAEILVLDHHVAEGPSPPNWATVNPNRIDCTSGLGHVCAATIAFLTAIALLRTLRRAGWFATRPEPDLRELLDLVALATVCDVMPLTGLNRALVTQGLRVMARRARPGIAALLDAASAKDHTAFTCGFALGPRINAAGRIGTADLGLQLLLCDDPVEARRIAAILDSTNRDRQEVEAAMLEDAYAQAAAQAGQAALVIHGAGWHPGVVGIVAGRIKERHNRPTCVGALQDGIIRGSGRSVPGADLGRAIMAARSHGILLTGGGHAMAAGFSLEAARLPDFAEFLNDRLGHAASLPDAADLHIEGTLAVDAATAELAHQLQRLSPFGHGNLEPVFVLPRAQIMRGERIGREGTTIRAYVQGEGGGPRLKTLLFRARDGALADALLNPGPPLHLAGHLRAEEWNGTTTAGFFIADATPA